MTRQGSGKSKTAAKPRKSTAVKPKSAPTHEEIADLAQKFWAERGRPFGSPEEDWLRAEQELRGKAS